MTAADDDNSSGPAAATAAADAAADALHSQMRRRAALGALAFVAAALAAAWLALSHLGARQALALWLASEAAFVFVWRARHRQLNAVPARQAPERHDGAKAAAHFVALQEWFPFDREYLRYWFRWVRAGGHGARRGLYCTRLSALLCF